MRAPLGAGALTVMGRTRAGGGGAAGRPRA
jgi:hypothetical protein